ncbi:MAG: hypothetical protein ABSH50_12755 [Bryobacteraceae bacterium]
MNYKQRAALLIILIASVCGVAVWGVARYRYRSLRTPAQWLERLPSQDAAVLYVDFAALRQAGVLKMLAGSKVAEEPEYKVFVMKTEFDYTRDLDAVMACFTPRGKYMVVKGRFDWNSLQGYARDQGGTCRDMLCRMNGSTPERKISFFPLRPNLMGLAVSPDEWAAAEMESAAKLRRTLDMPEAPVWVSVPPALLKSGADLPPGTRMFAHSMESAADVNVALAPAGNRFEARLNVECRDAQQAAALAVELSNTTALLRSMIEREHLTPSPRDLSGVLTSGTFNHLGMRVLGSWPIERGFVEDLLGGGL